MFYLCSGTLVAGRGVSPQTPGPSDAHCGPYGHQLLSFCQAKTLHSDAASQWISSEDWYVD